VAEDGCCRRLRNGCDAGLDEMVDATLRMSKLGLVDI
jgi:hypothetical protein